MFGDASEVDARTAASRELIAPEPVSPIPEHLHTVNRELQREISERMKHEQQLTRLTEQLELRVKERTSELEFINQSLYLELIMSHSLPIIDVVNRRKVDGFFLELKVGHLMNRIALLHILLNTFSDNDLEGSEEWVH